MPLLGNCASGLRRFGGKDVTDWLEDYDTCCDHAGTPAEERVARYLIYGEVQRRRQGNSLPEY